jgi:trigger factor
MARISQLALAACLAASALHTNAFTAVPSRTLVTTRNQPLFLSSTESKSSSLKRLPESAVELTLHIPAAATSAAYDKVLSEVSKKVSIPGFRKGAKIPPQVIENAWSKNGGKRGLKTMAINELAGELIESALKGEHDLEPIGQPSLVTPAEQLAESFTPGEELDLVLKCDVWPEIQWKQVEGKEKPYVGLKGSYKRKPFNQAAFDAAMRDLLERYAKLEQYDDASHALTTGDACKVNMVGYMATPDGEKGEPLPNAASGDDVEVILGEGRYMEGLVEGLEGGKVGETKTVKVRFPAALKNKELAGKEAIFDVEILSASRRSLPELTDEFANQVREGLTVDLLKEELRKAVDSQDAQEYMGARNAALGKALSEIIDVEVPDTLVTNQAREKYALMMTDMRDNGMADEDIKKMINPENFIKYKDIEKPDIVRDFKISMAVDEIARLENIQVPAYQVEEQIQSLKDQAAKDGQSTDDMDNEQMRRKVESTLERRMVYDLLADEADLEVEYVNEDEFDEALMEKLAQESLQREQEAEQASEGKQQDDVVATAAVVEEEVSETVTVQDSAVSTDPSSEEIDASKYDGMDQEEKAFNILKDLGMVELHADPDSPDFDPSLYADEEED